MLALLYALALASAAAAETEWARVQWVLDGDSVRLADGRDVRLIGINAPELGKEDRPDQPLAAAARERLRALAQDRTVQLIYDAERLDRHGRTLAYLVLADGGDPQEILLREGLAWFVAVPPNVARLPRYRAAEAQARSARRGVWAVKQYEPIPAERLRRGDTGFARITGTVAAVHYHEGTAALQLTDFVHLALPYPSSDFPQTPQALVGKRILARGWLTEYKNGLRMRVTHPAMLELLP